MRQLLEIRYTAAARRFPLILEFLVRRKSNDCSLYSSLLCVSFVYNQKTDYATSIGNDWTAHILILFYVPKFNWVTAKFINPQELFTWQPWAIMVEWMINGKVKCTKKFSFVILTNVYFLYCSIQHWIPTLPPYGLWQYLGYTSGIDMKIVKTWKECRCSAINKKNLMTYLLLVPWDSTT